MFQKEPFKLRRGSEQVFGTFIDFIRNLSRAFLVLTNKQTKTNKNLRVTPAGQKYSKSQLF